MIPVAAWIGKQLADPVIKWGGLAALVIVALTTVYLVGYVKGKAHVQKDWDASLAQHARLVAEMALGQQESTGRVVAAQAQAEQRVRERIKFLDREVVRYVQAEEPPCAVDTEYVRIWDDLTFVLSVRGDHADADPGTGASPAGRGVGGAAAPVVPGPSGSTDHAP